MPDQAGAASVARLRSAGCVAAEEEAALLEAAAGGDGAALEGLVCRREAGEPLAWLLGWAPFGGARLAVAPGVYVPRPHTEALAARAAALLPPGGTAVDLCCGSGAVAASLRRRGATVVGVDLDPWAAACAGGNGVAAVVGDIGTGLAADGVPVRGGVADVVAAVPPYVPTGALRLLAADVQRHEPRLALDGGADGLDLARAVVAAAARLLKAGGHLLVELGGDEDLALAPTLAAAGFVAVEPWHDEDGDLRGLVARRGGVSGPGSGGPGTR